MCLLTKGSLSLFGTLVKNHCKTLVEAWFFRFSVFFDFSIDFDSQKQQLKREDQTFHLTDKESKILRMFCLEKGELVERDKILKALWGESNYFKRRSMDVFISKIRKYLSHDPSIRIANVHGRGFILED